MYGNKGYSLRCLQKQKLRKLEKLYSRGVNGSMCKDCAKNVKRHCKSSEHYSFSGPVISGVPAEAQ